MFWSRRLPKDAIEQHRQAAARDWKLLFRHTLSRGNFDIIKLCVLDDLPFAFKTLFMLDSGEVVLDTPQGALPSNILDWIQGQHPPSSC